MKTTRRSYDEAMGDFDRLAHFIMDNHDQIRTYSTWCIGRFVDWKYGLYEHKTAVPDYCSQNAQLWFDGFHRLVGFVISEDGDANFAILTLAGCRFLFAEMLAWALVNWADRGPGHAIEVTARQTLETAVLKQHGFSPNGTFYTQAFDLSRELVPRTPLAAGFSIVDMAAHPDYAAQQQLRADAFRGESEVAASDLERELLFYNHTHQGPIYHPQTDLGVMAEDGRFVAGCEALLDVQNGTADIERVCTHSRYRRRGFARAVILECLYRLRDMGIRKAYITGYSQAAISLYASLGTGEASTAYIYKKL
ncbi:MAG: GNAT family N-acetyltransferase [Anaerolineales bacterium]|nr:GNAT family N-acetyltransferase [Anaerolineales bacterium]